ncbi:MAG: hypothetical protein ACRDA3_04470 [Peptostreptococcaceae bacterium]
MKEMTDEQYIDNIIKLLKEKLDKDYKPGETKRDAHSKCLGLLKARFIVNNNLPKALRVGVFKEKRVYPALIRISSSSPKTNGDNKKDVRGFAIKLIGVNGKKYTNLEINTQDFLLVSTSTMPIGTVKEFHNALSNPLIYICKSTINGNVGKLKKILSARQHHTSPLDICYYSTTPYMFGQEVVKYCIVPTSKYKSTLPKKLTSSYLTDNMQQHLNKDIATFDFMVQLKKHTMPIEDASIEWSVEKSPYIKVGEIIIDKQNFNSNNRYNIAENLSFSPGNSLIEHKPIGNLNKARVKIYNELSNFRHLRNNEALIEPTLSDFENLN